MSPRRILTATPAIIPTTAATMPGGATHWQLIGTGVRPVLKRGETQAGALVSCFFAANRHRGRVAGFSPRTVAAPPGDLFPTAHQARAEADLRRVLAGRPTMSAST